MSDDLFPEMPSKRCTVCRQVKKVMHFTRDRKAKDGYSTMCRSCTAQYEHGRRSSYSVSAGYRDGRLGKASASGGVDHPIQREKK